ncbi:WXG100 family type VII secretion target [Nocardioides sp.]|uniref:WXG100 family type VII secretion target n=1 Tax=Nocardioides sp. TaxID=35761 RepID=UPI001A2AF6A7|nr:WXG100 family type VII secretion target [Nocardioides sp.]MBJ7359585.1 WXG100 family type VII secretion target [Nocardioides sp.]
MTGFDGLLVDHAALDQAALDLSNAVRDIDGRMNQLEEELRPLQSDWTGRAKDQYAISKQRWNTAIYEMLTVLGQTSTSVSQSNNDYISADQRGAASFQY